MRTHNFFLFEEPGGTDKGDFGCSYEEINLHDLKKVLYSKTFTILRHATPIYLFCRLCHIFALLLGLGLWFWSTLFGLFLLLRFLPGGPLFLLLFLLLLLFLFRGGGRFILKVLIKDFNATCYQKERIYHFDTKMQKYFWA